MGLHVFLSRPHQAWSERLRVTVCKHVVTLLTDTEFEELTQIADEEEESVSALVHQLISRYLARHR